MDRSNQQTPTKGWINAGIFTVGLALGAGLMYMLDPSVGRRRRAHILEKGNRAKNLSLHTSEKLARHLKNRAIGLLAVIRPSHLKKDIDDLTLRDRIRSRIGRKVRHPGAIKITVANGEATLCGPVLADEVESLLALTESVIGIKHVKNLLDVHENADKISSLQGSGKRYLQERGVV